MTQSLTPQRKSTRRIRSRRSGNDLRTNDPFWTDVCSRAVGSQHRAMSFVIQGDFAMFTDIMSQPSTSVSYPIPTYSALQNILRHMAPHIPCTFVPLGLDILNPIRLERYDFNLTGPGRKEKHEKSGGGSQFGRIILHKPSFRIYFGTKGDPEKCRIASQKVGRAVTSYNHRIHLGIKEFLADHRLATPDDIPQPLNFVIPLMLKTPCYEQPGSFEVFQSVHVTNGRVVFPLESEVHTMQSTKA